MRLGTVADWVNGVDAVEQAVAPFTPEAVASRCGMGADTIRDLARQLATTERAAVYARIGTCTQEYGTLASWLVDVLNVLTGHLDAPGGAMFAKSAAFASNTAGKPGIGKGVGTGRHRARVSGAPEVYGELPMTCLAEEIETPGEGQIRALFTVATNPVLSSPNGPRLAAALEKLDFMVSMDIYLNETTRHADVILPGVSPLEDFHYDVAFPQLSWRNHARYSPPVLPRTDGAPEEWQTLLKLAAIAQGKNAKVDANALDDAQFAEDAQRLFGAHADAVIQVTGHLKGPHRTLEVALRTGPYGDQFEGLLAPTLVASRTALPPEGANLAWGGPAPRLSPDGLTLAKVMASNSAGGIDLGELQPRIPEMLRTPSGKIELAPPSFVADLLRPATDLARPAPDLMIIGRRDVRTNNSWMHNLPVLAKGPFRCTALVHPIDAERLNLTDGALAHIANGPRSIQAQVQISAEMMPGVVSLPHGWGHNLPGAQMHLAAERPGANLNALLDDQLRDPLSGNAVLGGVAITMQAIPQTA